EKPSSTDPYYGRLVSFVDIDADSDDDLFLGHQYYREGDSLPWHYLRFYRNTEDTGFGFWRTRVVTGQSWYLVLENELPFYTWVVNASGGELNNPSAGAYSAGDVSGVVDIIDSSNGYRVYIDVLPEVTAADSKAVLVVGSDSSDPLYNTFVDLASYAYWVLRNEGLPAEAVRLYAATQFDADEDGTMDVEDAPNEAALEQSITDWAVGTDRLLVYLVDHGQRERFRLNATEYLDASTYAAWVNTLQPGGVGPQVTTIIDTCEAGTFIDDLGLSVKELKADAQRITIASSGIGPIEGLAMFDAVQDISFSLSFWRAIFDGETYGQAFDTAKVAVEAMNVLQAPQIDDDGDGIPNEANDGLLANLARPGAEFAVSLPGVFIGDVAPNQAIASNSATLWLSDVVTPFPVDQAGALVIPPNFQRPSPTGDDEQPVTGMDWVDFAYNADLERWETSYSGFVVGGLYTILYYIDAGGKYNASPRIGFVDRIDAPDAWETDDAAHQARWIPANSVQGHNFHAENDQDWIRFASPTANAATIAVMPAGHMCQPAVALYKQSALDSNPGAAPVRQISAEGPGEEVIFEASFVRSEQYLLRIMNNDPLVYGAGTSYLVIVAVGTGGVLPNTLVVSAFDSVTSDPVAGASVTFDHTITSQTTSDGVVQFICPDYASYNVSASKTGYNECSQDVNVNHQIESVSISLVPESGEGEGEGEGPTQCAVVQGRYPGGPFGHLNGDVILFAALTLLLLGPKRRRVRTRS
ncbi:MAG TPA: hypothetical protein HPP77_05285, partial [Candidatus Hydrogenedentes bacterium]|nr:hypothetical protein [Candidatus Hydrogenedentota bacterium]